ncbi:MAG: hypothetical protein M0Q92_13040 [Methanoregula sp.]|nr:hypothetical protein [Methanoregula sp.]
MSVMVADILIYLLLLAGAAFGGIALMGLLIFPDLHSRLYTALRACLICMAAVAGAAITYVMALGSTGGEMYAVFGFHVLILTGIAIAGILLIDRQVLDKTRAMAYCGEPDKKKPEQETTKS